MRNLILLAILAAMALPAGAARRVTVAQLQTLLTEQQAARKSDGSIATLVESLEPTEELTGPVMDQTVAKLKLGPKTALALEQLADSSAFIESPDTALPARPIPDAATQQAQLNAAVNFVAVTLRHMPDFLATRVTRSFNDAPQTTVSGSPLRTDLHLVETYKQDITYRDGRETSSSSQAAPGARAKPSASPGGLVSWGEFGPMLKMILIEAAKGKVAWSHWEQTPAGPVAVFHYQVPKEFSHFSVGFCCIRNSGNGMRDSSNSYQGTPGYHGLLSLDPATGSILRITIESELEESDPVARAAVSIQYGTVEIGEKQYVCPVRSVTILSARTPSQGFGKVGIVQKTIQQVNDVSFTNYHRFGSTMRLLTDDLPQ